MGSRYILGEGLLRFMICFPSGGERKGEVKDGAQASSLSICGLGGFIALDAKDCRRSTREDHLV